MENYTIGCDAHKYYSQISVLDNNARVCKRVRIEHTSGAIQKYLEQFPTSTPVALECVGNWYWIVDEIEAAGCTTHAARSSEIKQTLQAHLRLLTKTRWDSAYRSKTIRDTR